MKKGTKVALALFGAALVLAACSNTVSDTSNGGGSVGGTGGGTLTTRFVTVMGSTVVGGNKFILAGKTEDDYKGVFRDGRSVAISTFYMCDHVVTQAEYKAVMGVNPSFFDGTSGRKATPIGETQVNRPVEKVSWFDAIYYCNKKSLNEGLAACYAVGGKDDPSQWGYTPHAENSISGTITCNFMANGYRLPTEAEWEYAARGGKDGCETDNPTDWAGTDNSAELCNYAWYESNGNGKTHEVKRKKQNSLGLYDMSGNVWEWCWDRYDDTNTPSITAETPSTGASSGYLRVTRGGCWGDDDGVCSAAIRGGMSPYESDYHLGFRVVRTASAAYAITVTGGTAKNSAGSVVTSAAAGDVITIVANAPESGKVFDKWTSSTSGVTFASETLDMTTFTMPTSAVSVTANYKNLPPAPTGFVTVAGGTVVGGDKFILAGKTEDKFKGVFRDGRTVAMSTFWMCDHEVTQAEYNAVMGSNPSSFNGTSWKKPATGETQENRPVEQVSWYDAITYCNKKSIADGLTPCYTVSGVDFRGAVTVPISNDDTWNQATCDFSKNGYRLPTEAEWEYAARGGKAGCEATTPNSWAGTNDSGELGKYDWFTTNSGSKTHAVKTEKQAGVDSANSIGLYDMSGNVCEWCWDWYDTTNTPSITASTPASGASSGSNRVFRGGCWSNNADYCSVARRGFNSPNYRTNGFLGFRVVRTVTSD